MQIDVHAHALPPDLPDILSRFGPQTAGDLPPGPTVEERIAEMDRHEIDVQILSLPDPEIIYLAGDEALQVSQYCNDYLAWLVGQHPERFRALASIPLNAGTIDDAGRELVRCIEELGMVGFSVGPRVNGSLLDDPSFDPLYEEANRLGTTMVVHPAITNDSNTLTAGLLDTSAATSRLIFSNFFGRFLSVKVVVAHLGGAIPYISGALDTVDAPSDLTRSPGEIIRELYVDTALAHEPALQCAIDTIGIDHILFGSGHLAGIAGGIETLEEMKLGRRDKRKILGDNAAGLFNIHDGEDSGLFGSLLG